MTEDLSPTTPPPAQRSGWTGGRVTGVIGGSAIAVVGALLLLLGLGLIAVHAFARDDDDYYTTDSKVLESDGYAVATDEIDLGTDIESVPEDLLGTVRIRVTSSEGRATFVGIGPTDDVDAYLDGVGHSELTDFVNGEPTYDQVSGGRPAGPPSEQKFWVAESQSAAPQSLEWDVESGNWSIVLMNATAASGVSADADIGVKVGWLIWAGIALVVLGLVVLAGGIVLIVAMVRRTRRPVASEPVAPAASP
jgi:uncharacterized membrane protein